MKKLIYCCFIVSFLTYCNFNKQKDLNVIFISLDTVRYDYVDYGKGAQANTPALRVFSISSVVFEKAFVTIPQTLPSHLSIFTSYYPHELGVKNNRDTYDGRFKMLQEVLKQMNYYTYGLISLASLMGSSGFNRGFDEYNDELYKKVRYTWSLTAEKITAEAIKKLEEIKDRKFFMFVHYSDPHEPYAPPYIKGNFGLELDKKPIAQFNSYIGIYLPVIPCTKGTHEFKFEVDESTEDFDYFVIKDLNKKVEILKKSENISFTKKYYGGSYILKKKSGLIQFYCERDKNIKLQIIPKIKAQKARQLYKEEVEYMDYHLGKFIESIKCKNLFKKTIIVIFSDHGEGLGERAGHFGHINYLNQQYLRVPLMIYIPKCEKKIIKTSVSLKGLSSTILDYLNIKEKGFNDSFLDLIKNDKFQNKDFYSFVFEPSASWNGIGILRWPYQSIFYWDENRESKEFYNLGINDSFSIFK